jgi:hypothetical protein
MKLTEEQIAHIKSMEDARGGITPDAIVKDAKRKASPLHDLFDWNETKAARAWWLECAREIIRTVQIIITTTEVAVRAPYYTHDPDAPGQGYRSVTALQREPTAAREALLDELTRAVGVMTRARNLSAALNLEQEFDAMLAKLTGLRRQVEQIAA